MVFLDLVLKVVSDNVNKVRVSGSDFKWYFVIKCTQCKEEHPNEIYFTIEDQVEMTKGHGNANFMMYCKNCHMNMSIMIHNKSKMEISCENGNDEEVFATFECRGCLISKWIPKEGFVVVSNESDKYFEEVDISNIWCEYDEIAKVNCSFLEPIEYKIEKNKKI